MKKRFYYETAGEQERIDAMAIRDLADRYTDAVNHRDWDTYKDCWIEDSVWDLGVPVDRKEEGIDAIMKEVQRAVGGMDLFVQMPHAFTLLELDENTAKARVTLNEIGRVKEDAEDILGDATGMNILAVYTDDLVKSDDGLWRYKKRRYDVRLINPTAPDGEVIS